MFHAHIPAQKFSSEEKRALADALNLALHEAMDTPMDDRFVIISEHKDDEFFIHPTFPDMKRSDKRMIVTVTYGTSRTVEQKRKLAELVTRYAGGRVAGVMCSPPNFCANLLASSGLAKQKTM